MQGGVLADGTELFIVGNEILFLKVMTFCGKNKANVHS
jgi:hypothetical protein